MIVTGRSVTGMPVPYVAPLCPAGRLPLKGGHGLAFLVSPFSNVVGSCATPKLPISPFEAGQSQTAVRANFLLSVSGCALNTSPLKGWRKCANLRRPAPFLAPFRGRGVEPEGRDGEGARAFANIHMRLPCPQGGRSAVSASRTIPQRWRIAKSEMPADLPP